MPKRNLILVLAIAAAAFVTVWVTRNAPPIASDPEQAKFKSLIEAYNTIHDNFYPIGDAQAPRKGPMPATAPTDDTLRQGAVRGMIRALHDEYSMYIPPDKAENFRQRVMGRARTLGLNLEQSGPDIRVLGCLVASPAYQAGVVRGDVILAIDGRPLAGMDLNEIKAMLDGKIGTGVTLDLVRPGGKKESLTITRQEFAVESVEGLYRSAGGQWVYRLGDDFAYVRISEFVPGTREKVQAVLRALTPLRGIVLDLRDNPGGEFNASLDVAGLFLREGTIATVFSRNAPPRKYRALENGTLPDSIALVVLIDDRSASGAEIVAGSLKVNDRAVLVGVTSRGKGCIQNIYPLDEGRLGLVNLTTSEYYVGDDQPVARRGISPHVELPIGDPDNPASASAQRAELARLRLAIQLSGPRPATAPATEPATMPSVPRERILELDNQLAAAMKLLEDPAAMQEILTGARKARLAAKAAAASQAASQSATASRPGDN